MTKFFDLVEKDFSGLYARAFIHGTFEQLPRCPKCKQAARKRVPPLILEWHKGSNVIADFTWPCGLGELVVSDRVKTCFESNQLAGIGFEPVQMWQHPRLKRPKRESYAKNRVWLPYDGPPLWGLVVTASYPMDVAESKRTITTDCQHCGRGRMIVHDSKAPLVVRGGLSGRADLFRIQEMGGIVFGTEVVKQIIEENGFTNVQMKERGSLPS